MTLSSWKEFFHSNIKNLNEDSSLRLLQLPLILIHFLSAIFFLKQDFLGILTKIERRICWPFFENCLAYTRFSSFQSQVLFSSYLFLALVCIFLFFKKSKHSLSLLVFLEIFKLLIQSIDYRFMGNYHFMPHVFTLVYLLAHNKSVWLRIWLASFYWSAASLKTNPEWLAGNSLSFRTPFGFTEPLPYFALLVLLIEINVPFLLLSTKSKFRHSALFIFLIFHLVSFYWVGFFYPMVMVCLLSVFLIIKNQEPININILWKDKIAFIFWIFFIFNQMRNISDFREFSLNGYQRLYSLNMYDASSECMGFFLAKSGNSWEQIPFVNHLAVRVRCDNVIFWQQARNLCREKNGNTTWSAYLYSRLGSDTSQTRIESEVDVCKKL